MVELLDCLASASHAILCTAWAPAGVDPGQSLVEICLQEPPPLADKGDQGTDIKPMSSGERWSTGP